MRYDTRYYALRFVTITESPRVTFAGNELLTVTVAGWTQSPHPNTNPLTEQLRDKTTVKCCKSQGHRQSISLTKSPILSQRNAGIPHARRSAQVTTSRVQRGASRGVYSSAYTPPKRPCQPACDPDGVLCGCSCRGHICNR
jgi:hypothetical protein